MRVTLFFVSAMLCGLCLNFVVSLILSRYVKRKSGLAERVRISSIDEANTLRRKTALTPDEKARLWAAAMNILMRAESEELAARYMEKTALALGEDGAEFRKHATKILEKRFGSDAEQQVA